MERASNAIRRCAVYTTKVFGRGSRAGLQFAACAARSQRGLHQEPAGRRLETGQDRVR